MGAQAGAHAPYCLGVQLLSFVSDELRLRWAARRPRAHVRLHATRRHVECTASAQDASLAPPPGLPPPPRARRADAAAPAPLSKSPTDFASDGSSESSERPVGSGPGSPARADSFGQKLRRAASFGSTRRRKAYEETSLTRGLSSVH